MFPHRQAEMMMGRLKVRSHGGKAFPIFFQRETSSRTDILDAKSDIFAFLPVTHRALDQARAGRR